MMFGMGFASLFGILAMFLIGWGLFNVLGTNRNTAPPFLTSGNYPGQDALDILKQRYARGEISKEEYQRMRADLTDQ